MPAASVKIAGGSAGSARTAGRNATMPGTSVRTAGRTVIMPATSVRAAENVTIIATAEITTEIEETTRDTVTAMAVMADIIRDLQLIPEQKAIPAKRSIADHGAAETITRDRRVEHEQKDWVYRMRKYGRSNACRDS